MRALKRELGGGAHVGVVGPEDDDRVAPVFDGPEPLHDRGERSVGVGMHVVVADADRLVVGQLDHRVVGEQQLEHVVAFVGRARNGAEHTHTCGPAGQGVEGSEGDGRLARVAFGRADVDAVRHSPSLLGAAHTDEERSIAGST